jgi:hypothetical protein
VGVDVGVGCSPLRTRGIREPERALFEVSREHAVPLICGFGRCTAYGRADGWGDLPRTCFFLVSNASLDVVAQRCFVVCGW